MDFFGNVQQVEVTQAAYTLPASAAEDSQSKPMFEFTPPPPLRRQNNTRPSVDLDRLLSDPTQLFTAIQLWNALFWKELERWCERKHPAFHELPLMEKEDMERPLTPATQDTRTLVGGSVLAGMLVLSILI